MHSVRAVRLGLRLQCQQIGFTLSGPRQHRGMVDPSQRMVSTERGLRIYSVLSRKPHSIPSGQAIIKTTFTLCGLHPKVTFVLHFRLDQWTIGVHRMFTRLPILDCRLVCNHHCNRDLHRPALDLFRKLNYYLLPSQVNSRWCSNRYRLLSRLYTNELTRSSTLKQWSCVGRQTPGPSCCV